LTQEGISVLEATDDLVERQLHHSPNNVVNFVIFHSIGFPYPPEKLAVQDFSSNSRRENRQIVVTP